MTDGWIRGLIGSLRQRYPHSVDIMSLCDAMEEQLDAQDPDPVSVVDGQGEPLSGDRRCWN